MNWQRALYNRKDHEIVGGVMVTTNLGTTTAHSLETCKLIGITNGGMVCIRMDIDTEDEFVAGYYNEEWKMIFEPE